MKKIFRVFTRDFDQCLLERIRMLLLNDCATLWGKSISDQIIHFNGRAGVWWRYVDDMQALKAHFVAKALTDPLFSDSVQTRFVQSVAALRQFLQIDPAAANPAEHFRRLDGLFSAMYPYYPVALFVPGPWRQDFIAAHGKAADGVLKRLENSRHASEGVVKETGLYLRRWLEPLLKNKGYLKQYVRLLTLAEVETFVKDGTLPAKVELEKRSKGFVHYQGTLIPTTDFDAFLRQHGLIVTGEASTDAALIKGTVASTGPVLRGRVQIVMNSYDAATFKAGGILVTPMTSPEYLSAMKASLGIITDEGGLTCHAAITARELGVPCIIGTKVATKMLKDGDVVEMNATDGTIRKL